MMRRQTPPLQRFLSAWVLVLFSVPLYAQGSAGTDGGAEPRYLIDAPTAGMLSGSTFAIDVDFFQQGGVLLGFSFGFLDRISLGLSYGGSELIGDGTAMFNPVPGVHARVRPLEEGMVFPAFVLGFDSQGKETFYDETDEYAVQSKGFYVAASKNFGFAGYLSVHGGVNYSLEGSKEDRGVDFFLGLEKTIGPIISAVLDYSSGGGAETKSRGFLNLGLRCSVGGGLTLGFDLKDLTKNGGNVSVGNRSVKIEFVKTI